MTTDQKIARRKLSLLELASELSNVSKACKLMGYSRQQFYEIRRNFQTYGAEGLIDRLPGARGPHPNRVAPEIETAILAHALEHPCHGATRVEQELRLKGIEVSAGGVRGVWLRHGLATKHERLLRLEKETAERQIELKEEQIRLLERFSPEFRERHIEAPHTGALVAVDTFFVGALKGVGKVYLQTAIDCHSRKSNTAPRGSSGPSPTASPSASTAHCSTNTSGSKGGAPGSRPSARCRPSSTTTSRATIQEGLTRAAA